MLKLLIILLNCVSFVVPLWCYNCSATQTAWSGCGEEFTRTAPGLTLNRLKSEVQCSGENASCFVRSLSTRSRHSWVVQRGCYYPGKDDSISLALVKSRRRMACKNERLPDAEYTVCLCRTDLCNAASQRQPQHYIILLGIFIAIQMRQNNFVL